MRTELNSAVISIK